jgi:quercetin 2,3-dioxygenase
MAATARLRCIKTSSSYWRFCPGQQVSYRLKPGRQAWLQVARGDVSLNGTMLNVGDGAAISVAEMVEIKSPDHAEILLFDLA